MARAKGRDVVLELMESVARLEATTTQQAEVMKSLAEHAIATSVHLTALSGQMADVSRRMTDVSQRMDSMSQRMSSLETDAQNFAQLVVTTAKLSQTVQKEVGRLASLLSHYAGTSNTRFDTIEGRLDRLEKKTG